MALLDQCTAVWGTDVIHEENPRTTVVQGGYFLPYTRENPWGILDAAGTQVQAAIDFREGVHAPPDQEITKAFRINDIDAFAPDTVYIYGGRVHTHFGHFIINTLSRFWDMQRVRAPGTRILCHGVGTPKDWFAIPFIGAAFRALGLTPADFVFFPRPTSLRYLIIPHTSLEEQHSGFKVFRTLCASVGKKICDKEKEDNNHNLLYYSKTRLKSAVSNIENEHEIEEVMKNEGIDIVYPEFLSFSEQIQLMSSRKNIICTTGSFLHATIFCPSRRLTCLNLIPDIHGNYAIIDKLAGNDARYYYSPAIQVISHHKGPFQMPRHLPNAKNVARELISLSGM